MQYTTATLVHRVPDALRAEGRISIEAAPGFLEKLTGRRGQSAADAAWTLTDSGEGNRAAMVPVPIAIATAYGDRGPLFLLLGIDIDGALAFASRESGRTRIVRAATGGLDDPVVSAIDEFTADRGGLYCTGPMPDALDVIRRIRAGLVGEIEHRPVNMDKVTPDRSLPTPWLDEVFAAVAEANGADQRQALRRTTSQGRIPTWIWNGPMTGSAIEDPAPGTVVGLPDTMPPFHLQNRSDADILKLGSGIVTYRRRGAQRFLAIARASFPDTIWASIGEGTRADRIWNLPGLDRFEVERIDDDTSTLIHLRPVT